MNRLTKLYQDIETDMAILAGEDIGDAAWQDVAGTLACNLRVLADSLEDIRRGRAIAGRFRFDGVFPSMREICNRAVPEHQQFCGECGEEWPCSIEQNRNAYRPDVVVMHTVKR